MQKTSNFNLLKPEGHERYDVGEFNQNMEIIDRRMYANMQGILSSEQHIADKNNPHNVSKDQVGLGSVDNTSDAEKPVSIQQQAALDKKQNILEYDSIPTEDSMKMVRSGGIFAFIKNLFTAFKGATTSAEGTAGIVPAPSKGSANRFLRSDGTWAAVTKSNVGLANVGNFKAVSTSANQSLSDTEKTNARNNIGAGTSDFGGDFSELTNVPTWVKQKNKPSYNASEVGTYSKTEIDAKLEEMGSVNNLPKATSQNDGLMTKEQAARLANVQSALSFDALPTENSNNMVKSGGIFKAIKDALKSFVPSTADSNGEAGLVPPPPATDKTLFLSSTGDWKEPSKDAIDTFSINKSGLVPAPAATDSERFLKGDGTWGSPSGNGVSVITDPGLARKHYAFKENVEQSFESIFSPNYTLTISADSKGERVWTFSGESNIKQGTIASVRVISTLDGETYTTYCVVECNADISINEIYTDTQVQSLISTQSFVDAIQTLMSSALGQCVSKTELNSVIQTIVNEEIIGGAS